MEMRTNKPGRNSDNLLIVEIVYAICMPGFFKTIMANSNLFRYLNYDAWTGYLSLQHRYFPPTTTFHLACYKNTFLLACLISCK